MFNGGLEELKSIVYRYRKIADGAVHWSCTPITYCNYKSWKDKRIDDYDNFVEMLREKLDKLPDAFLDTDRSGTFYNEYISAHIMNTMCLLVDILEDVQSSLFSNGIIHLISRELSSNVSFPSSVGLFCEADIESPQVTEKIEEVTCRDCLYAYIHNLKLRMHLIDEDFKKCINESRYVEGLLEKL